MSDIHEKAWKLLLKNVRSTVERSGSDESALRKKLGMDGGQFNKLLGKNPVNKNPTLDMICRIAVSLDTTPARLLADENELTIPPAIDAWAIVGESLREKSAKQIESTTKGTLMIVAQAIRLYENLSKLDPKNLERLSQLPLHESKYQGLLTDLLMDIERREGKEKKPRLQEGDNSA